MTEIDAAQYVVQNEWQRTLNRITEAERSVAYEHDAWVRAVADLARLRDVQTQLEAHAGYHGWELKRPVEATANAVMGSTS